MSRELAVNILQSILKDKEFFTQNKEDAFINMLILTTLRHLVYIKKAIKQFAKKKLPEKASLAEHALYLATAEVLYMNSPDYAVINSYVDIVKKATDKYVAGFVNAVLRNICKNKEELIEKDVGEFFPAEFFRILNLDYKKNTINKIQKSCLIEPPLDITVKKDAKKWGVLLDGKALDDFTIRLNNRPKITELKGYAEGEWWVQDFASSKAVKTLGNLKGKRALDICAAPGGKTAQLINKGAQVTALDVSAARLETLKENLTRLNMQAEEIICTDGLDYLKSFSGEKFDLILLDAPCSATGTIRRHPEIVHIKNLKDIEKQAALQKEFLTHITNALKPNGTLVYCVCSISMLEGEHQIAEFLKNNPAFTLQESIRTTPKDNCDAFFIAKLNFAG